MNNSQHIALFVIALVAFVIGRSIAEETALPRVDDEDGMIPWKEFTPKLLERQKASGKSVLLVFVADWCGPCQQYMKTVLATPEVRKLVVEKRIVPVMADLTKDSPEAMETLKSFGEAVIPKTVVFSADSPKKPTAIIVGVEKNALVAALKKLVPSMRDPVKSE